MALPPILDFVKDPDASPDRMNLVSEYLVSRLQALEVPAKSAATVLAQLQAIGLTRIADALAPVYAQAVALRDQLDAVLASYVAQGLPAAAVVESGERVFLTAARRSGILSDALAQVRDGVGAGGDTLAKVYALVVALKGSADAAHDSLGELAALVDANAAAVASKADAATTTTALGNRLRLDAPGGYGLAAQLLGRQNLGARGAGALAKSAAYTVAPSDAGRLLSCAGTWALILPSASKVGDGFAIEVGNTGTGKITLTPAGTDTIRGGTTLIVNMRESGVLVSDGANWHAIGFAPVVVAYSFASSAGYVRWSNGWTKQWGLSSGDQNVSYPLTFSSTPCVNATTWGTRTDASWMFSVMITRVDASSFDGRLRYIYGTGGTVSAGGEQWMWSAEGWI